MGNGNWVQEGFLPAPGGLGSCQNRMLTEMGRVGDVGANQECSQVDMGARRHFSGS